MCVVTSESGVADRPDVTGGATARRVVVKRSVRKAGSVGGSRMMECEIVYPGGRYMERIITWRKHGTEVSEQPLLATSLLATNLQRYRLIDQNEPIV